MYFLSSRENFSLPVGKCKFKYSSLTSDHFSEEGRGHDVGRDVHLTGLLGEARDSTVFSGRAPLSDSCAHGHLPLSWSKYPSQAFEVGGLTQFFYSPVNYLANYLWSVPSSSLHCTDNGIILRFCWGNCYRFLVFL